MINAVRQKLNEMEKSHCENPSLHGQEKGKSVNLVPRNDGEALKIIVDGRLITDTKRCDCLYFYQASQSKRYAFLVELKGKHYVHALEQIEATLDHPNFNAVVKAAMPNKKHAVVIVSKIANTNRPNKEDWEREHGIRLRVFACDNNESIELVEKVVKSA